jgi:hypothetical protein
VLTFSDDLAYLFEEEIADGEASVEAAEPPLPVAAEELDQLLKAYDNYEWPDKESRDQYADPPSYSHFMERMRKSSRNVACASESLTIPVRNPDQESRQIRPMGHTQVSVSLARFRDRLL